jgi:hypothetical protein
MDHKSGRLLFREVQRFPLRRIGLALLTPPCIMLGLVMWQVVLGHHWKRQSLSNGDVLGWTIFLWMIYLRLITVRLVIEVRDGDLVVRLRGFWRKRCVPLAGIRSAEAITFDPERDYGGYGIRTGPWGQAYIARGSRGVRLEPASGPALVVGSQRSDELAGILRSWASIAP